MHPKNEWRLNHTYLTLSFLASAAFLVLGNLLFLWKPTHRAGQVLVDRVVGMVDNWENETLRSFIELGIWLGVIWATFDVTGRLDLSLLCGTMSGCLVVLCGEALTPCLRELEQHAKAARVCSSTRAASQRKSGTRRSGAQLVDPGLLAIYGIGGLRLIYENVTDIVVAGVLAGLAGCALLGTSALIAIWPPTRRAGEMLQDRILNTRANWNSFPSRSATESAMFLGVTIGTYANLHQPVVAVQAGLLAGMLVCFAGEVVVTRSPHEDKSGALVPPCVCAYLTIFCCHVIFARGHDGHASTFTVQLLLAICCGVSLQITSRLLLLWKPTRRYGCAIRQRFTHAVRNWETRPLRSAFESGCTNACSWISWRLSDDAVIAGAAAIISGIGSILLSEAWLFPPATPALEAADCKRPRERQPEEKHQQPDGAHRQPAAAGTSAPSAAETNAPAAARDCRLVTPEELSRHASEKDCWVAVHGEVYDVSKWRSRHPGGADLLLEYCGMDATDQFELFHPPRAADRLRALRIGKFTTSPAAANKSSPTPIEEAASADMPKAASEAAGEAAPAPPAVAAAGLGLDDYRALRKQLWEEGAFEPRLGFYACKQLLVAALLALSVGVLWSESDSTAQLVLAAVLLALALQQAAFLGHDTLHNGVLSRRGISAARDLLGQLNAGAVLGISSTMWLNEHNAHHAYTLRPHQDPQFTYFPLWLQSAKEIGCWMAELPKEGVSRRLAWRGVKLLVRVQHITFLPIVLAIGRYNFLAISWVYAVRARAWRDMLAMGAHLLWFGAFVALLLPTNSQRLQFVVLHYSLVGILHVQLLVSHLCTEQFTAAEEKSLGLFQFQLLTTRNISSEWWSHWFHGGLELQIEHHLFPQLPRHQLRAIAPRVRAIADRAGVPYKEMPFLTAVRICLEDLSVLAKLLNGVDCA